ncbi:MAG TPA: hypothetical protein VHA30_02625 [Patescibacteria group bacterium]|nr:hypothetical protein [Patescibacteria group bacterium]
MHKTWVQWAGWYGLMAILAAYALASFGVLGARSLAYQLLNLTGSLGLIIETYAKKDYQPLVLNVLWVIIALGVLLSLFWK